MFVAITGALWGFLWPLYYGEWTKRSGVGKVRVYKTVAEVEYHDQGSKVWPKAIFHVSASEKAEPRV